MKITYLIPVLISALCLGCSTSRHSAITQQDESMRIDSVVIRETVRIDTVRIPAEETTISVQLSELSIRDTVLTARGNWSHARVESSAGTLKVTATCDSLERLVKSLQREVLWKQAITSNSSSSNSETIRAGVPWYYKAALALVILYGVYKAFRLLSKIN